MRRKAIKRVVIKLIVPGEKPVRREFHAGRRKVFTPAGIEGIVAGVVAEAEERGLGECLRLVQIGPAEFNLVSRDPEPAAVAIL